MGVYRFILAIFVVISHSHISFNFFGYDPGVTAVISFLIICGYVMTSLIEKYYKAPFSAIEFYLDRAARLFPQYIFYLLLASFCIYNFSIDVFYVNKITIERWLLNVPILPLGYYMVWSNTGDIIIPQAWSLGLEMSFYLVIPWIIRFFSFRNITILIMLSLTVFTMASFGKINSDWYGYRLLPGTLFIFLTGSLFYRKEKKYKLLIFLIFLAAGSLLFVIYHNRYLYHLSYIKECLAGLLIGIPAVGILKRVKFSAVDEFFGNLAYGVFLNQFFVLWMVDKVGLIKNPDLRTIIIIVISCFLSYISCYFVEGPALAWRRKLRSRRIAGT